MKVYEFKLTLTEKHMKQLEYMIKKNDFSLSCSTGVAYDVMNDLADMQDSCDFVEVEKK